MLVCGVMDGGWGTLAFGLKPCTERLAVPSPVPSCIYQANPPSAWQSLDFPRWLNAPETREKLQNKTVMMYCTGGIRCERATALLNQMTVCAPDPPF